jgi:hypothetical protein
LSKSHSAFQKNGAGKLQQAPAMLLQIYQETDAKLKADTFLYSLCRVPSSQTTEAPTMAQEIIRWMVRFQHKARLIGMSSLIMFDYVLQTWVNSKHPKSGEYRTASWRDWNNVKRILWHGIKLLLYTAAIRAYAIHGNLHGAQRMFDQIMEAEFQNGNKGAQPSNTAGPHYLMLMHNHGARKQGRTPRSAYIAWNTSHRFN